MASDLAGDPVSSKSKTGLVAQIGNHTVKSGSTLQSLTASSVGETEFYAVVKGGQVGLSLRSMYQDLGIPMKFEIQSDSSTANSLMDRLGAGQELHRCWKKSSLCFSTTTTLQVCRIGILLTMDPTLHYKMKGTAAPVHTETRNQKHRNRHLSTLIVNIETDV